MAVYCLCVGRTKLYTTEWPRPYIPTLFDPAMELDPWYGSLGHARYQCGALSGGGTPAAARRWDGWGVERCSVSITNPALKPLFTRHDINKRVLPHFAQREDPARHISPEMWKCIEKNRRVNRRRSADDPTLNV